MSDHIEDNGDPLTGRRRSDLLFGFASVAYAVVAKDVFPAIYSTLSDGAHAVRHAPGAELAVYSREVLLEIQPFADRAALAVALLFMWGFYFWSIIGIRSTTTQRRYSANKLIFDMGHAVCLYCAASSLHDQEDPSSGIAPSTWLAVGALSLMYHVRFLRGLQRCVIPPADGMSIANKIARNWIGESLPAAHFNCLVATFSALGFASSIEHHNMRMTFNCVWVACFVYVAMTSLTVWVLRWQATHASNAVIRAYWTSVLTKAFWSFLASAVCVLVVEIVLLWFPGTMHGILLTWRQLVPLAAVLLLFMSLSAILRASIRWGVTLWRSRGNTLDEVLAHVADDAKELYGDSGMFAGFAHITEGGSVDSLTVCGAEEAQDVARELVLSVVSEPRALECVHANVLVRRALGQLDEGMEMPMGADRPAAPFVLVSARRRPEDTGSWVAFLAQTGERGNSLSHQGVVGLAFVLADRVARFHRKALQRDVA